MNESPMRAHDGGHRTAETRRAGGLRIRRTARHYATALCLTALTLVPFGCAATPVYLRLIDENSLDEVKRYDDGAWAAVLLENVKDGLVDYDHLAAHPERLLGYLRIVAALSPDHCPNEFPTSASRLAFYINAFNAAVVAAVLDAGACESVHNLHVRSFEDRARVLVGRRWMSLADLRHRAVIEAAGDARVVFTLCDAAVGSPPLADRPFRSEGLDDQLRLVALHAMNNPKVVNVDHEHQTLNIATWMLANREPFFQHYRRRTGAETVTMLNVVLDFAAPARRDWLNTAAGYRVGIIPFDRRLNNRTND